MTSLRALIAESRIALPDDLPQAAAGLYGYLGYDMVRLIEHLPDVNPDPLGLPDALMLRPRLWPCWTGSRARSRWWRPPGSAAA